VNKRPLVALVALGGLFVALYLTLYKLGYIGTLVCAVGSCEKVQTSKWARLFNVPVAVWGVLYYVAVLGVSLAGLTNALSESRRVSLVLSWMTGFGVLFSAWLTYLELFVIDAICQWCVVSAILAATLFVLSLLDLRDVSHLEDEVVTDAAAMLREARVGDQISNTGEVSRRAMRPEE